jgi:hypothetical protein
MVDREEILVDNLQNALEQAQKYVIAGILSAGLCVLVDNDALMKTGEKVDVPFIGKVSSEIAFFILFVAFFFSGCFAVSATRRARKIISKISDKKIVNAALTYFSILTIENIILRVLAVLLAPGLIFGSLLIDQYRSEVRLSWHTIFFGALLYFLPYIFLLYQAITPFTREDPEVAPNSDK